MNRSDTVFSLNFMTFGIVLAVLAIAVFMIYRRRSTRKPMAGKPERNVAERLDAGRDAQMDNAPRH